jgi:hypothetical protein
MNELVRVISDEAREDGESKSGYLPILTVVGSGSKKLIDPDYRYLLDMVNKMAIIENGVYLPVGLETQAVVIDQRRKATRYKDGEYTSVLVDVSTGADPLKYKEWRDRAKRYEQGYKFGPEFLVYLPEFDKYATLFVGTDFDRKVCSSKILDGIDTKHTRFTLFTQATKPTAKFQRTVIAAKADDFDVDEPDKEEMQIAIAKFQSPPSYVDDPGDDR